MATITLDETIINDMINDGSITITATSISWERHGYQSSPQVDFDVSIDGDISYEDEDFVDKDEHDDVLRERDEALDELRIANEMIAQLEEKIKADRTTLELYSLQLQTLTPQKRSLLGTLFSSKK